MKFKAIIFDLDGTLLDTLEDVANSVNRVLERHGFPTHSLDDYRHFVGYGVAELIKRVVPLGECNDSDVTKLEEAFREEYSRNWNVLTKPYEGIAETLDELNSHHLKMAVLSNKPDDFTKRCVDAFLPDWSFDMVLGHHRGIPHKPDPTGALQITECLNILPEDILYVGDSAVDMKTAIASGMFPVGALWGFRSKEELQANGAQALVGQPQEILTLLAKRQ